MNNGIHRITSVLSKIFNNNSPYNQSRNYYRQRLLDKYSTGFFYIDYKNKIKSSEELKTKAHIELIDNKKLSNVSIQDIVRKFGHPNHNITCRDLLGTKVFYYKQKFSYYRTKLEFHFFENQLFFYSYTFSYLNISDKEDIIQTLKDKYLDQNLKYDSNTYFVDDNQNTIFINDGVEFSIYYSFKNNKALDHILKHIEIKKLEVENERKKYKALQYKMI